METAVERKLGNSILRFYGLPSMGFQMWISIEIFYFAAFLTDYVKLSMGLVGTILLITSLVDIITVPIAGIILQKSNMKWGKYRSWLLVGPIVAAIFFTLQFVKMGAPNVNAAIIIIGFVVSHLILNIYYGSHVAMNNSISKVREERITMSANRGMFTSIGTIIFAYFGLKVITTLGASNPVMGYTLTVILTGLFMIICYLILFKLTKNYALKESTESQAKEDKLTVPEMIKQIIQNPPLLGLMISELGRYLGRFVVFGMAFYYFKYVVNSLGSIPLLFTGLNVVTLLGALVANPLAKKFGEKKVYIGSLMMFLAGLMVVYFVPQTANSFVMIMFIAYLGYGIPDALAVAMYSSTVDYGEWKTGKNAAGFIMSLILFPIKGALFIRSVVITAVLSAAGYIADMEPTVELIDGIKMGIALVPSVIIIIGLIIITLLYKINSEKITEELKKRRQIAN